MGIMSDQGSDGSGVNTNGLGIGIAVGVSLGLAMGNIAVGIAVGVALGLTVFKGFGQTAPDAEASGELSDEAAQDSVDE